MTRIDAAHRWPSNAHLIEDVARLGYLRAEDYTLDPTHGQGVWWRRWRPERLVRTDIIPANAPDGPADFTTLPWPGDVFDAVAFDPPYRLNGRPDPGFDIKYGTQARAGWQERHELIRQGITECFRVLRPEGILLVKCQDQVCGGRVRWQTHEFTEHAEEQDSRLVDSLLMIGGRPQPPGRRQVHANHNYSTLLVFRKATRRGRAARRDTDPEAGAPAEGTEPVGTEAEADQAAQRPEDRG